MSKEDNKEAFLEDLADALEVDKEILDDDLNLSDINWDSLSIVSSIAIIDEHYNCLVSGESLANCKKLSDIFALLD